MSKRLRVDDSLEEGRDDGSSVADQRQLETQKPQPIVLSPRFREAWLELFRSRYAKGKVLGRLILLVTSSLRKMLEGEAEIWKIMAQSVLGKKRYKAVPLSIRESMGDRWLLREMTSDQVEIISAPSKPDLSPPEITSSDVTLLVDVWRKGKLLVCQSITGEALQPFFGKDYVPCFHSEYQECPMGCNYDCWPDKEHPGELEIKLPKPIYLKNVQRKKKGGESNDKIRATVQLLIDDGHDSKCIHLLRYKHGDKSSQRIVCCEGCSDREPFEYELENEETKYHAHSR